MQFSENEGFRLPREGTGVSYLVVHKGENPWLNPDKKDKPDKFIPQPEVPEFLLWVVELETDFPGQANLAEGALHIRLMINLPAGWHVIQYCRGKLWRFDKNGKLKDGDPVTDDWRVDSKTPDSPEYPQGDTAITSGNIANAINGNGKASGTVDSPGPMPTTTKKEPDSIVISYQEFVTFIFDPSWMCKGHISWHVWTELWADQKGSIHSCVPPAWESLSSIKSVLAASNFTDAAGQPGEKQGAQEKKAKVKSSKLTQAEKDGVKKATGDWNKAHSNAAIGKNEDGEDKEFPAHGGEFDSAFTEEKK